MRISAVMRSIAIGGGTLQRAPLRSVSFVVVISNTPTELYEWRFAISELADVRPKAR